MAVETDRPDPRASLLAFFGAELLRIRTEQGLNQQELGKRAHIAQTLISFIEGAKRVPTDTLCSTLDDALGTGGHFTRLYPLVVRYAYPNWFLPFVELEQGALTIRTFESQVVPALLQTEGYARALQASWRPDALDELVAARMSRQELLVRHDRPRAWFVLDEQVLRRQLGGRDVMLAQLELLVKAAQEPRTVIQVLPSRCSAHPGLGGPFTILSMDEGPDVLYVDGFSQGRMGTDAGEVSEAARAYDLLKASALSPDDSADLIGTYRKGLQQ